MSTSVSRDHPESSSPWPRCLRSVSHPQYEIRDSQNRRIPPTLAGYRLRPNRSYHIRVRAREAEEAEWTLHPVAGARLIEWQTPQSVDSGEWEIHFRTQGGIRDAVPQIIGSPTTDLRIRVSSSNRRRSEVLSIPVVVAGRWVYAALFLLVPVSTLLLRYFTSLPAALLVGGGIGVLVAGVWLLDGWRIYRCARRLTQEITGDTPP